MNIGLKRTMNLRIHYKSGSVATIDGIFSIKHERGTWEWECCGKDRIFMFGADNVESVNWTHNGFFHDLRLAIWRHLPTLGQQ